MKKKELSQIKSLSVEEIKKKLKERQMGKTEEVLNLKMGKTKNVHAVAQVKKEIAQLKTIISLKTISQALEKNKESKKEAKHATS